MALLNCSIEGSGTPVVFIHGFPLSSEIWQEQADLADQFKVITLDLPGYGQSPYGQKFTVESLAEDIAETLSHHGIEKCVLFGHSMGGYIALAFAEKFQDKLLGFGLVSSHPYPDNSEKKTKRIQMVEQIEKEGHHFLGNTMMEMLFAPESITTKENLINQVRKIIRAAKKEAVKNSVEAMMNRPDRSFIFIRLRMPTLLITGVKDSSVDSEMLKDISALNPRAKVITLEKAGHMPMLEQPDKFNDSLRGFLTPIR